MTLYTVKQMKESTLAGGTIGPMVRQSKGGGKLTYAIDKNLNLKNFGQAINSIVEFRDHLGFLIQFSTFNYQWLMIPKINVLEWGFLKRQSIPVHVTADQSSMIAGLLLYGPIGAILGSAMDDAEAAKQAKKPVIGITYRSNGTQGSIFVEFPINQWYHELNTFLLAAVPDQHKD
jgi:hypothetical protein